MIIKRKKRFIKSYKKLDRKIQDAFDKRIWTFSHNPFESSLNNHALTGEYRWFRSIDITWDYRTVFREYPGGTYELVELIDIGTHSQLYG